MHPPGPTEDLALVGDEHCETIPGSEPSSEPVPEIEIDLPLEANMENRPPEPPGQPGVEIPPVQLPPPQDLGEPQRPASEPDLGPVKRITEGGAAKRAQQLTAEAEAAFGGPLPQGKRRRTMH